MWKSLDDRIEEKLNLVTLLGYNLDTVKKKAGLGIGLWYNQFRYRDEVGGAHA